MLELDGWYVAAVRSTVTLMRGTSAAWLSVAGAVRVGPVTLPEPRRWNLRELLTDLSRPGVCIVLGAGASAGIVPMNRRAMAELVRELLDANSQVGRLRPVIQNQIAEHPEVLFVADLLRSTPRDAWDRVIADISPLQATVALSETFRPRVVPDALVRIYDVIDNKDGAIVSYNYDRITDRQKRFRVISPHGQRLLLPASTAREMLLGVARELHSPISVDWWLPIPETTDIALRSDYQEMVLAWRRASTIVLIGYGFGGGDDSVSYEDFGANVSMDAHVHVLCPRPDNVDLCRQVGHVLRGRGRGARPYGQEFRWRSFAESVLESLRRTGGRSVRNLLGRETEVIMLHDAR